MDDVRSAKVISTACMIMAGGCLWWLLTVRASNQSLREKLDTLKLKSEILLSEKLEMEKALLKASEDIRTLEGENQILEALVKNGRKQRIVNMEHSHLSP